MMAERTEELKHDDVAGRREHRSQAKQGKGTPFQEAAGDPRRRDPEQAGFPTQEPLAGKKPRKSRNAQFAALALAAVAVILIVSWIWPTFV